MAVSGSIAAHMEGVEEREGANAPHSISMMQGVNESDLKKLRDAGIFTIEGFHTNTTKKLLAIKGFSEAKVEKLMQAAAKVVDPIKFEVATEVLARQENAARISTGASELDEILAGGFELGKLTEVFGEAGAGKTQLLKVLSVRAQLSNDPGKVVWIDTEGAFSAARLSAIADAMQMDASQVLDNVVLYTAKTHDAQLKAPAACCALFSESEFPYRLVVIDSMMSCFRSEFSGRGELSSRQQILCRHMREWRNVASIFSCAIVYSNQITADPGNMFVPNAYKAIGGNIMKHNSHLRLEMKGSKKDGKRTCSTRKSAALPCREADVLLCEAGIANYA